MSGQIRYSDEFKIDAVAQVTERGYSVKEVVEWICPVFVPPQVLV
jgi:transposase